MSLGRMLIVLGLIVLVLGVVISFGERLPIRLGRLPGDIVIRGKNSVFYFPLATCLLISVILSLIMWIFNRR
jgi:DUF2905 family protein